MVEAAEEAISARQEMVRRTETSLALERKAWHDGRRGAPVIQNGEQGNTGKRKKVKAARERTQRPSKKIVKEPSGEEVASAEKK